MTSFVLAGAICLAPVSSAFASSTDYTSYLRNGYNYYGTTISGTTTTISKFQGVADLVAQLMASNQQHLYNVASKIVTLNGKIDSLLGYVDGVESSLSSISGYVDGLESTLNNIYNKLPSSSWFSNLSSYVDGLEASMSINNTRLSSILSAIQNLASDFGLETSQGFIWTKYDGSESTITQSTSITDLLGMLGGAQGENFNGFYSLLNSKLKNATTRKFQFINGHSTSGNTSNPFSYPLTQSGSSNLLFSYWIGGNGNWEVSTVDPSNLGVLDYLYMNNQNSINTLSRIVTPKTLYPLRQPRYDQVGQIDSGYAFSLADLVWALNQNIVGGLSRIGYVIADADTVAQKQANKDKSNQVMTDFTGASGATLSDFTGAKDSLTSVSNGIKTGTNISNILGIFDSSDGYSFFSQNVADDINGSLSNSRSTLLKSNTSDIYNTPLLDEKMNDLYSVMGVEYGK